MSKETGSKGKPIKFFNNVKSEMKKVIWPTKTQLLSYTSIVLFTCVLFSLGIWVLDSIFKGALNAVLNIKL